MYADDIVLVTVSVQNLQYSRSQWTEKCYEEINSKFNVSKCTAMRIVRKDAMSVVLISR